MDLYILSCLLGVFVLGLILFICCKVSSYKHHQRRANKFLENNPTRNHRHSPCPTSPSVTLECTHIHRCMTLSSEYSPNSVQTTPNSIHRTFDSPSTDMNSNHAITFTFNDIPTIAVTHAKISSDEMMTASQSENRPPSYLEVCSIASDSYERVVAVESAPPMYDDLLTAS